MESLKANIKKPYFYVTAGTCLLALVSFILYLAMGATQYNQQKLASIVVVMLVFTFVLCAVSLFFDNRFVRYGAAVTMLFALLEYFINEVNFWSNWIIATDPVAPNVLAQYFVITILMLLATIGAFAAAIMNKKAHYSALEKGGAQ